MAPILVSYILALSEADNDTPRSFGAIVSHGELYLLASTYTAVGIGELVGINERWQIFKIVNGGMSLFIGVISIALYVKANSAGVTGANISILSYWICGFSCLVATSCVAVSEVKE